MTRVVYSATLYDLLKAYGTHTGRRHEGALHILPTDLYSMDDALKRQRRAKERFLASGVAVRPAGARDLRDALGRDDHRAIADEMARFL